MRPEDRWNAPAAAVPSEVAAFSRSRVVKGVASTILAQAVSFAQAFLLVPLFLRAWGVEMYGHWLSLTAMASYLALLDLGGQTFVGNKLAAAVARNDRTGFADVLQEAMSLYLVLTGVAFLALAAGVWGVPVAPWTRQDRLVLMMVSTVPLVFVPGGLLASVYRATGLFVRGTVVGHLGKLAGLLVQIAALATKVGPVTYACVYMLMGLALITILTLDLRQQVPELGRFHLSLQAARRGTRLMHGSLVFWVLASAQAVGFQGVILVISAQATGQEVALYSTHRTAANLVSYGSSLIMPAVLAEMTFLTARGDMVRLVGLVCTSVRAIVLASGGLALALAAGLPLIYPHWARGRLALDFPLAAVLVIQSVMSTYWGIAGAPLIASNQHGRLAKLAVANAVVTVGLAVIAMKAFGVLGVALAALFSDLAFGLLGYPCELSRRTGMTAKAFYLSMLRPLGALVPLAAATVACSFVPAPHWRLLFFSGCAAILFPLGAWIALGKPLLTSVARTMPLVRRLVPGIPKSTDGRRTS